jgi:hypothetical protein
LRIFSLAAGNPAEAAPAPAPRGRLGQTFVVLLNLTFFVGEQRIEAASGAFVHLPRFVPHGFQCNSAEARLGANDDERRGTFVVLFSGMSGAMAMARACGDKDMRERILSATRAYYLATFAAATASR